MLGKLETGQKQEAEINTMGRIPESRGCATKVLAPTLSHTASNLMEIGCKAAEIWVS